MKQEINDEFSHLKISRQRKYQLRQQKRGRCVNCNRKAVAGKTMCLHHLTMIRERMHSKRGCKRHNPNASSYKAASSREIQAR